MSRLGFAVLTALLTFSSTLHAMLPEGGWYWNRAEPGRGFNIEIQSDLLFVAGFVYDQTGKPIWITSGGKMSSDRLYAGPAYVTSNGQCIGCAYHAPDVIAAGIVTVRFTDESHAVFSYGGTDVSIERQQFGYDLDDVATPLLGEWSIVEGSVALASYFGERISFKSVQALSSGPTATGTRTGSASRIAVGYLDRPTGLWVILLDSSTSYYTLYTFRLTGLNHAEGNSYTYLKGTAPSGFLAALAYRTKSPAAANGSNAPGVGKAVIADDESALRTKAAADGEAADITIKALAVRAEALLP